MLMGILTALKIIGLVLLVLILLILFLACLILFVPVRYRIDALVPETEFENGFDTEKIEFKAYFSWLFHILRGGIDYPKSKEFTVKLLWITLFPRKDKPDKDSTDEDNKDSKKDKKKEKNADKDNDKDLIASDGNQDEDGAQKADTSDESSFGESVDNSENSEEDKALIEILTDISEKILNVLKTPQTVFEKIQYTISRVCDKIGMIKSTLENDIFKRAFELVKKKLIKLIKMILPDKIRASVLLGTGDPADTAEVMAIYSAFYPVLYKKVSFEPDFERKVVRTELHAKGHITIFTVLYCVLVCYFNKDVKKVIKRFKKIFSSK